MKVLFIGTNPSTASQTNDPLHNSTKSRTTVNSWISDLLGADLPEINFEFANVSNIKTKNNKPLRVSDIRDNLPYLKEEIGKHAPDKIIALGKTAEKALTLLQASFYEMPHPSGLNRQLNDKNFVAQKLKGLKEFLLSPDKDLIKD